MTKAEKFIEDRLVPPLLHGDDPHQQWLREELRKWIPDLDALLGQRDTLGLIWARERWNLEVSNRPMRNVYRRILDDTWRQVMRYFGGNPDELVGPDHDTLLAASPSPHAPQEIPDDNDALKSNALRECED